MIFRFDNVPIEALGAIAADVRDHGVNVSFEEGGTRGHVSCASGTAQFDHYGDTFTVVILENKGHFPERMLRGGLRQLIEEGIEKIRRKEVVEA
jgi:hypothetical protein